MLVREIIPVIGIKVYDEKELEKLGEHLTLLQRMDAWVQLASSWRLLEEVGVGEITDTLIDYEVNLASVKLEYSMPFDSAYFEKVAVIADESKGRTIIVSGSPDFYKADMEKIYEIASIYKVKVLFEPSTPADYNGIYSLLAPFMGGILGLSIVQEHYPSTDSLTSQIRRYLQITKNLEISNYKDVEPAPLLIPFKYNNPKLLRFLVRNRFEGFLTVNYERSAVDVRWLVREFLNLREQLATLEEKED